MSVPETQPFVHLHARSAYSLLEGALPVSRLVGLAAADAMPALALTDTDNLFGALEFSELAAKAGIQPIVGATISLSFAPRGEVSDRPGSPAADGKLVLLAKDAAGYANLMWLSSAAFLSSGETQTVFATLEEVAAHSAGLIALTGGPDGAVDRALAAGNEGSARARLTALAEIFGDRLYVELQRHGLASEAQVEPALVGLAYALGLPLVATNEAYFAGPDDFEAHDALLCIAEGTYVSVDERRRLTPEHGFKSQAEMQALFADLPEAIENTVEIARRCAFRPLPRAAILPRFVAGGEDREAIELRARAEAGLAQRLDVSGTAPGHEPEVYAKRLAYELDVITRMNYQGYFLIVADFIQWAKAAGIPVGPGRGSGAGSLVAWALTITDLDPLRFGLLFERFLNPERVSMPDFDIDFCQERRDEVIRYVQERYGVDRVAQIITFGKLQARAVLRDVGRVLQMPYGQVDRLCKLVPNNPANPVTLAQAIAGEPRLQEARDQEPIVTKLLDIAQRLEGLYRHASTHAAGVVIADRPMQELVPLYRDPRAGLPATQFNMKWVEAAGLVKFDFLGLKTLTVIDKAIRLLAQRGLTLDFTQVPLDDEKTYQLLARGDTVGVFQLEGSGMRDALRKLKPDRFEDIIAIVALYRPGPMDNIDTYVARKHGQEQADELHPVIQHILAETYGVIIYQEQVMRIAEALSGYSPGEADLLRRAMGKKIKSEMDQQKSRFIEGAVEKGVDRARAGYIFELVAKFAGYGFNKSHAAAYAVLAYQTAYLKANHPVEFLAASMTLELNNTDKLQGFVAEARRHGIKIEPPCVNASGVDFLPGEGAVRYSLAAVKTLGRQAVEQLCAERDAHGPFRDIGDFAGRLGARVLNKRALENMAAAGAFDVLVADRAVIHANADRLLSLSRVGEANEGQNDLFGGEGYAPPPIVLRPAERWGPMEKLTREHDAVGLFLSGHPLDTFEAVLRSRRVESWAEFSARAQGGQTVGALAGVVTTRQERKARSGVRFGFIGFSDPTGQFEAVAFAETLTSADALLQAGQAVLLQVEAEPAEDSLKVRIQSVTSLDEVTMRQHAGVKVYLDDAAALRPLAERLNGRRGRGELRIVLRLGELGQEVEFLVPGGVEVAAAEASALEALRGVSGVRRL